MSARKVFSKRKLLYYFTIIFQKKIFTPRFDWPRDLWIHQDSYRRYIQTLSTFENFSFLTWTQNDVRIQINLFLFLLFPESKWNLLRRGLRQVGCIHQTKHDTNEHLRSQFSTQTALFPMKKIISSLPVDLKR